jgi:adenylyltransferase/sulfurtransferase
VDEAVRGSNFIVMCLDEGQLALAYRLNRSCLRLRIPSISVAASGLEVVVGPTVSPGETACYMCYRMRLVAGEENPEARYDFESFLDRRRTDDSAHRANLVTGPMVAAHLAATDIVKQIGGLGQPTTRGRLLVFDLRTMTSTLHTVLRKPWCPACFADWDEHAEH